MRLLRRYARNRPRGRIPEEAEAGIDARENPDFCIIARTDAMVSYGREEAVRRANKYLEAGAGRGVRGGMLHA